MKSTPKLLTQTKVRVRHGLRSVNTVRSILPEVIKLQTGLDVKQECYTYYGIVDSWVKSEGKRSAVLRLKNIYISALRSMVDEPVELPWIKTNRRGFPKRFAFLEKIVLRENKSPTAMQAVLSILGYYRGILAPGIPEFGSITDPCPEIPANLIDEILDLGLNPEWKIVPKKLAPAKLKIRSKKGPNGQATICAFQDLGCLTPNLLESMKMILSKSNDPDNLKFQISNLCKKVPAQKGYHSRLAIKRERGGKDRVFAMVDYWTQIILEPLHQGLSKILREIPEDCTYDQAKNIDLMKQWTREGSAISLDLSSASDRFPLILQHKIMERLTGCSEFSKAWVDLMVNRDFTYKSKTYRWNCGQPLGAHSSWPSFALAHHVVMRAAFKKASIDSRNQYSILGDDMAAKDSKAISYYSYYLNSLGVATSPTKGLKGNSCEFAKRLFWKGDEISPIPVQMLFALVEDECLLPELIAKVSERSSSDVTANLQSHLFLDILSDKLKVSREKLSILFTYPIPQMRNILSEAVPSEEEVTRTLTWNSHTFSFEKVWDEYNEVRFAYLIKSLDSLSLDSQRNMSQLNQVELPGATPGIRRMHPMYYGYGELQEEILEARSEARGFLASRDRWVETPLIHLTNVTALLKGSIKGSRNSGKLLLKVYYNLLESQP